MARTNKQFNDGRRHFAYLRFFLRQTTDHIKKNIAEHKTLQNIANRNKWVDLHYNVINCMHIIYRMLKHSTTSNTISCRYLNISLFTRFGIINQVSNGVMYFQLSIRCLVEFDKAVFFRRIYLQYT